MEREELLNSVSQQVASQPVDTEQEAAIIDGLAQSELQGKIQNAAENYNLANDLDSELLKEIGQEVWNGFHDDDESRTEWLEKHAFWLSLYMQTDYAQTADAERDWGATESIPILTEAANQFQARTYKIFFPNDTFVSAIPMRRSLEGREQLEDRAERIGRHMSYQLGFEDRSYKQDKDALFLGMAVHGSFFTKTYYNAKKRRFKTDNVRPTDLVINYHVGAVRIEDVQRKTQIIYTTVGQTEDLVKDEFFIEAAVPGHPQINSKTYNLIVEEASGIKEPSGNLKRDKQAVLLEQHAYFDLGDGIRKPYIVTICAASKKVLRLIIGYRADPQGNPKDDFEQVQYFTHYKYQENPDGFYGLGLGHAIGDLNSAANIMLRQSMDAATLANDGNSSGFVSERLGIQGDETRMVLGKFIKIPDTIGDFKNAIMQFSFPGPNPALISLMEQIDLRAQRLSATTEATTGSIDKTVQPTTVLSQIEQALEQFSSVQMRAANSVSEEFQKIYKINQEYLPLVSFFVVNGAPEQITRGDYADDMLIQPIFDPKYATQMQKVNKAQAELNATLQNPVNQGRPMVYDEAFRRYLEALDVEDIDKLVPPQPMVQNLDNQYLENAFYLMPPEARPVFDVFPEQNHLEHIAKMQEFYGEIAATGVQLTPEQQEAIQKHQQKHQGYLYGQLKGVFPAQSIGTPPVVGGQGNEMDSSAVTANLPPEAAGLLSAVTGGAGIGSGNPAGNAQALQANQ